MGSLTPTQGKADSAFLQSWLQIILSDPFLHHSSLPASTAPIPPPKLKQPFPESQAVISALGWGHGVFTVLDSVRAGPGCFDRFDHRHNMGLSHTDRATRRTVTFNAKLGSPLFDHG